MNKNVYITTPIYYVNDRPHIGHVYTDVCFDVLARYHKLFGDNVFVISGTDEHGQKNEKAAAMVNRRPMDLCNQNSLKFKDILVKLNSVASYSSSIFKNDSIFFNTDNSRVFEKNFNSGLNFIRTTEGRDSVSGKITKKSFKEGRHLRYVDYVWTILDSNGWIYEDNFSGWYCSSDECFYDESELINDLSPTGKKVEWKTECVHFFRLSKFQKILHFLYCFGKDHLNENFIFPESRFNEITSFLFGNQKRSFDESFLKDLCISRENVNWGIPVPNDPKGRTVYVWLDALSNYISAIADFHENIDVVNFDQCVNKKWLSFDKRIHVVGKDIIKFHAIYWQAFLIGLNLNVDELETDDEVLKSLKYGEVKINNKYRDRYLELYNKYSKLIPESILSHGWWTNDGEKISKSLGNGIYLEDEISTMVSLNSIKEEICIDYFRYFCVKAINIGNDGDYSRSVFRDIVNKNLSSDVGNFYSRIIKMLVRNFDEDVNELDLSKFHIEDEDMEFVKSVFNDVCIFDSEEFYKLLNEYKINKIISSVSDLNSLCTVYIEKIKPWSIKDRDRVLSFLITMSYFVLFTSVAIHPVTPYISNCIMSTYKIDSKIQFYNFCDFKYYLNNIKINLKSVQDNVCPKVKFE